MASRNGHRAPDENEYKPSSNGSNGKNGRSSPRTWGVSGVVRYAHIVGWGMKVPDTVLTNFDLEALVDTTDEWIRKGTGIRERRVVNERESVVTLGFEAARNALDRADVLPTEID